MDGFERYWDSLTNVNAGLREDQSKMTISVAAFRAAVERAFKAGVDDGKEFQKQLEKLRGGNNFDSLFGGMFGGRK